MAISIYTERHDIKWVVPVTGDPECASILFEALACEYQNRVIPSYYYEVLFANKENTFQSRTEAIADKVASTLEKAIEAFRTANDK